MPYQHMHPSMEGSVTPVQAQVGRGSSGPPPAPAPFRGRGMVVAPRGRGQTFAGRGRGAGKYSLHRFLYTFLEQFSNF